MIFTQTGLHDSATAYRVINEERSGYMKIVCGLCVDPVAASDPRNVGGDFKCEDCGKPFGTPEAFERADELLAKICPVAAKHRAARISQPANHA